MLPHTQNNLSPRRVNPKVIHQGLHIAKLVYIPFGVKADITLGPRRLYYALFLIAAQGVTLNAKSPGGYTYHIAGVVVLSYNEIILASLICLRPVFYALQLCETTQETSQSVSKNTNYG